LIQRDHDKYGKLVKTSASRWNSRKPGRDELEAFFASLVSVAFHGAALGMICT